MKIAVISVTKQGDEIYKNIKDTLNKNEIYKNSNLDLSSENKNKNELSDIDLYSKSSICNFELKNITEKVFENYEAIIFISSTGIAVRAISKFLKGKDKDPAVLVIDATGKYVISLLSGHLGGANELTLKISEILKAQPIITTATDNLGVVAPDVLAKENQLIIDDLKAAKQGASLLVQGEMLLLYDEENKIKAPKGYVICNENFDIENCEDRKIVKFEDSNKVNFIVYVTNKFKIPCEKNFLKLIRKNIILGIGCRKDYNPLKLRENILKLLEENNIDYRSVKAITTIEVKKNENAILEAVKYFNCDLKIFTVEEIKTVEGNYKGSDFVKQNVGVRAVCEPCVELYGGKLITGKLSIEGMTFCAGKV